MKWYERMRQLREGKGWNVAELSRRSGVAYENVAKYEQGKVDRPRGSATAKIAAALEISEQELFFGLPTNPKIRIVSNDKLTNYEKSGSQGDTKRIPQLTLSELARHQAGHGLYNVWSGEMSIVVDESIGENCIAVTVEDNSMLPLFSPGDVLICDPDAQLEPGNYVIAAVSGNPRAVFRKYRPLSPRGDRVELKPLNEDYPVEIIDADHPGHIIARCRKVMKDI